jgi:hypothetical protein
MSNGNSVNIRIDSRLFYGLVAVLAVAGIFAIGLYLGKYVFGTTPTTPAASVATPGAEVAAGVPTSIVIDPNSPANTAPQAGAPPVSADEVPVDAGASRIWIPEPADTNWQYDFGTISPNDKVEHDFVVQNVGTAVLEIADASASCGCTAAAVGDTTVEPGEETTIRVTYDPRVNKEAGKFVTKQIRVKSNDPLVPLAEFTITADVAAQ